MFRPNAPYNVAMNLLVPSGETMVKGTPVKTWPDTGPEIFGSFRTFGGTESDVNGIYSVIDTGTIETWYRPDITSECRVKIISTGKTYEIISSPENVEMRNKWLKFRVKCVTGGA